MRAKTPGFKCNFRLVKNTPATPTFIIEPIISLFCRSHAVICLAFQPYTLIGVTSFLILGIIKDRRFPVGLAYVV